MQCTKLQGAFFDLKEGLPGPHSVFPMGYEKLSALQNSLGLYLKTTGAG